MSRTALAAVNQTPFGANAHRLNLQWVMKERSLAYAAGYEGWTPCWPACRLSCLRRFHGVGWALLPVGVVDVGQECPTYSKMDKHDAAGCDCGWRRDQIGED